MRLLYNTVKIISYNPSHPDANEASLILRFKPRASATHSTTRRQWVVLFCSLALNFAFILAKLFHFLLTIVSFHDYFNIFSCINLILFPSFYNTINF